MLKITYYNCSRGTAYFLLFISLLVFELLYFNIFEMLKPKQNDLLQTRPD